MDTNLDHTETGTEARPARQRLAPEERREEILKAALAAFSDLGYTQATLNDVADRLGVTKGCLYHYFESKEQLLVDLIQDRICSAAIDEAEPDLVGLSREETLRTLLARIWEHLQQPGQIEVAILAMNELPKVPEVGRFLYDEVVARSQKTLQRVLQPGRCDQEVPPEEVERAARMIPLMIMGAAMGTRLFRSIDPAQFSPEQLGKTVTTILLHGLSGACPGADEPPTE